MFYFCIFISATDLLLAWNPVCLGLVEGVIGKIQLHTGKWRTNMIISPHLFFCCCYVSFFTEHTHSCQYFLSVCTRRLRYQIIQCLVCFLLTRKCGGGCDDDDDDDSN